MSLGTPENNAIQKLSIIIYYFNGLRVGLSLYLHGYVWVQLPFQWAMESLVPINRWSGCPGQWSPDAVNGHMLS